MQVAAPTPDEVQCPKCSAVLAADQNRCGQCGYTLEEARLYDPKRFVLLGILFSSLVPIFISASNWGQVGNRRAQWLAVSSGLVGFTALFTTFVYLPDQYAGVGRGLGHAINIPIALILRQRQQRLFQSGLRFGARSRSLLPGILGGVGLVIVALVGSFLVTGEAAQEARLRHGLRLLKEGQPAEAARVFEPMAGPNSKNQAAVFNLALCHFVLHRYEEAHVGVERYLKMAGAEADAYAFLYQIHLAMGRQDEAAAAAVKARQLDPNVFIRLFGTDSPGLVEADSMGS